MAFSLSSSVTTFSVDLDGSNGVIGTDGSGLYYTNNGGATILQSGTTIGTFVSVSISGLNAIASSSIGVYYSSNGGASWSQIGNIAPGSYVVSLDGSNGVAAGETSNGIYYTTNGGANWTISDAPLSIYNFVALSGSNGIAGTSSSPGIYYTTNGGANWTKSTSLSTNIILQGSLLGLNGVISISSKPPTGLYYTNDGGSTWSQTNVAIETFSTSALSGSYGIAGTSSSAGIYYMPTGSISNWIPSNDLTTGNFNYIALSGLNGIACSDSNLGIYYTTNGGQNWTQSNVASGNFFSVAISSASEGIVGSSNGLYYISTPLCFNKGTKILYINKNGEEEYISIENLKVGDLVKTYKDSNKKIVSIGSFNYKCFNNKNLLNCLYKMKDHDVILTGGHSILVDELTEEEDKHNKLHYNFERTIHDKKFLLACSSDKFEKIEDDKEYELFHFVLESENNNNNYGIYINDDILSESCPKNDFDKLIH
jgi:photosystem II stability/assembly factor-like uncharacterized protein